MKETMEQLNQIVEELRRHPQQTAEYVDAIVEVAHKLRRANISLAMQLSEEALLLANKNDYLRGRAYALRNLGMCQLYTDRYQQAAQTLEDSRQIFVKQRDDAGLASVLNVLGETQKSLGHHVIAQKEYLTASRLYEKIGDKAKAAAVLNNLGSLHNRLGDYSMALDYYYQALTIAAKASAPLIQAHVYGNLGDVLWRVGEAEQAIEFSQHTISHLQQHGNQRDECVAYVNWGAAQQSRGERQQALEKYQRGLELAREAENFETEAEARNRMGSVYLEEDATQTALMHLADALQLSRSISSRFFESETLLHLGTAYYQLGDYQHSVEALEQALEISQLLNAKGVQCKTHLALSKAYEKQNQMAAALAHYQTFHQQWSDVYGLNAAGQVQRLLLEQKIKGGERLKLLPRARNAATNGHQRARKNGAAREEQTVLPPRRLQQVIEFIVQNLEHQVTLAELAAVAGLSPYHFQRLFKRSTGKTPHQFLVEQRVVRAKQLLATTELPLPEVALRCGFSSQSHLATHFRTATGTTPRQFRDWS